MAKQVNAFDPTRCEVSPLNESLGQLAGISKEETRSGCPVDDAPGNQTLSTFPRNRGMGNGQHVREAEDLCNAVVIFTMNLRTILGKRSRHSAPSGTKRFHDPWYRRGHRRVHLRHRHWTRGHQQNRGSASKPRRQLHLGGGRKPQSRGNSDGVSRHPFPHHARRGSDHGSGADHQEHVAQR